MAKQSDQLGEGAEKPADTAVETVQHGEPMPGAPSPAPDPHGPIGPATPPGDPKAAKGAKPKSLPDQLDALDAQAQKQGSSVAEILIQAGKALLGLDLKAP